ncbi:uncharacterized protein LOC128742035 [Sabethes cyaneus]|uniref:uncharacterized protein LOC128742035 n=1 Tax=Sabethes cyaneus TaxID=53552 RepID=UPI00237D4EE4|nr:uncharacterized protein LOC128742035 [Sabethes cyaneus]
MSRVMCSAKHCFGLPLIVLLLGFTNCVPTSSYPAVSPCPNLFSYQYDTNRSEYYGFINLQSQPVKGSAEVELSFTIAAQLPTQYVGSIETIGESRQLLDQITKGRGVSYRVNLPIQDPLPRLTKLTLNGRTLCSGTAEKANFVTEVKLRHQLRADTTHSKPFQAGLTRPVVPHVPAVTPPQTVAGPAGPDQFKLIDHREKQQTVERTEHEISPAKNTTTYKYVTQVVTYNEYESAPMFQRTTHYTVNTTTQQ